jgi:hypothetical protein
VVDQHQGFHVQLAIRRFTRQQQLFRIGQNSSYRTA